MSVKHFLYETDIFPGHSFRLFGNTRGVGELLTLNTRTRKLIKHDKLTHEESFISCQLPIYSSCRSFNAPSIQLLLT